jgi:murein DD-endopeptidase MepM/ murein hydrolase activator NlpD
MKARLLWRLLRERGSEIKVLVIPNDRNKESDQYLVRPRRLRTSFLFLVLFLVGAVTAIVAYTPIADLLKGRDIHAMREQAITNMVRIQQLEDSLAAQKEYASIVSKLLGLEPPEVEAAESAEQTIERPEETGPLHASESPPLDWADHQQPAVPVDRMSALLVSNDAERETTRGYLSALQLPFRPPVDGFVTQEFDASEGHFAVDIAVEAGSLVRSIGDGHVIVADWGYDGGWTVAVHHADGYVSVYKHNDRLLKRVGDRVFDREPVAISGNTGEITTGPHIHFELWHEGLAQDPELYFVN